MNKLKAKPILRTLAEYERDWEESKSIDFDALLDGMFERIRVMVLKYDIKK